MAELAPINIPEAVPFAIAAGLGLSPPQSGDIIDHLIKRIRHQRLLLIIDNCEHLLSLPPTRWSTSPVRALPSPCWRPAENH